MTYKVQIDDLIRDATQNEIALIEAEREADRTRIAAIESAAAAKVSARAKLANLGLTDTEITALFGV